MSPNRDPGAKNVRPINVSLRSRKTTTRNSRSRKMLKGDRMPKLGTFMEPRGVQPSRGGRRQEETNLVGDCSHDKKRPRTPQEPKRGGKGTPLIEAEGMGQKSFQTKGEGKRRADNDEERCTLP